jgi:uncharacterized protein (DUF2336 family)
MSKPETLRICPQCDAATRATPHQLYMEAGVNLDGEGFVHLAWRKERAQLTPDEARQHALSLIQIAEAADYEAAFVRWCQARLEMSLEQAARMLEDLRTFFTVAEERPLGRGRYE